MLQGLSSSGPSDFSGRTAPTENPLRLNVSITLLCIPGTYLVVKSYSLFRIANGQGDPKDLAHLVQTVTVGDRCAFEMRDQGGAGNEAMPW